jgi:hypothetical protein
MNDGGSRGQKYDRKAWQNQNHASLDRHAGISS